MSLQALLENTTSTRILALVPQGISLEESAKGELFRIDLIYLIKDNWAKALFKAFTNAIESDSASKTILFTNIAYIFPENHIRQDLYEALVLGLMLVKEMSDCIHVIAQTHQISDVHPAVIRLFNNIVNLPPPTNLELHKSLCDMLSDPNIEYHYQPFSQYLDGLNYNDIRHIFNEAFGQALMKRKHNNNGSMSTKLVIPHETLLNLILKVNKKSIYSKEIKKVGWCDIGGYENVKKKLEESVILPITHADEFKKLGIEFSFGTLLYGAPGTGKTMFAKCVAEESRSTFYPISMQNLVKGYIGESEKQIEKIFNDARKTQPSIIFIDEFESLFSNRDNESDLTLKVYSQLVFELYTSRINHDRLHLLAATNHIEMIEPSLLVSGRIDRLIKLDLPSYSDRLEIIRLCSSKYQITCDFDDEAIASATEGMNCSEICEILRRAALKAIDSGAKTLNNMHFELEN